MNGERGLRVVLLNMPWMPIDVPSLALGILKRAVTENIPGSEVEVVHANLDFVDWITERYEFTNHDYHYFAALTYFKGLGDWVFSSALYDDVDWHTAEFDEQFADTMTDEEYALNRDLHRLVPEFVRELAARVAALNPDVVGLTSTYQQTVAGLALAKEVKRLAPGVVTVFGGANCDGPQGEALHRNFPWVDYVIRGEGEITFPQLLRLIQSGGTGFENVPGLCHRRSHDGSTAANPMSSRPLPPSAIVAPDYDGYFERLEESRAADWVEPRLVVEGARGCWWGEKHHCTFCGLNGSSMEFRSKSPMRFREEIDGLVRRHQILDMFVVDNILDMGYISSLLPGIIEDGHDLRMQYEIKSNLRRSQLAVLARAGLVHVQPGIESLDSRVLRIMDKGVTGCQNVRMLRDGASCGLSVSWNYLYGFPGETDADYESVLEQLPALHHLEPAGGTARIVIERFSPYFNRPELGFDALRPGRQYSLIHDLPEAELFDLAYLFESTPQGIAQPMADRLDEAIATWQAEFRHSRLTRCDLGDEILLTSQRSAFPWQHLRLVRPLDVAAFRLLDQPHTPTALTRKLTEVGVPEANQGTVSHLLREWIGLGLLFHDDGHYVHVVPDATNDELLRIDARRLLGNEALVEELVGAAS
ncbi:ribosomal peptide maturation radical SAM protein 1 [Catenulispora sp. GP43]|uniref:RiPP maturation radical SAM C-methyltransferase n=1 Tax=Catenulispora sp. GP43 TaxID=3156263 RepID=UPI0035156B05